jgi:hypothetical protein
MPDFAQIVVRKILEKIPEKIRDKIPNRENHRH